MSRTFEDRRREKQEKEQRKQVRKERLDAARREALEDDRRRERDAALQQAARKDQRSEELRILEIASRRAQARLDLTAQIQREILALANTSHQKDALRKQGLTDLRHAWIAARQDRAMEAQQKKQTRKAVLEQLKRASAPVSAPSQPKPTPPEPRRTDRKEVAKAAAAEETRLQRREQIQVAQEQQRRERSQQEARRLARKQLLAEQAGQAAVPPSDASEEARRARQADARAEQLRDERNSAAAKHLRDKQRRAQRKQSAAEAVRDEPSPGQRAPAAKLAERRLARKRAVAAVAQTPAPEEPLDSLSWLKTRGSFLVDELLNAVYLRGVTCRGFDDVSASDGRTFPQALSLDGPNLSTMTGLWGINIVRIPFRAATMLSGNSSFAADQMLAGLDEIVGAVTTASARVVLSMEPLSGDGPGTTPDSDTFRAWSLLANHYQDEPGVLYELFSSPQPLPDTWLEIAAMLVGTIRLHNPAS